jgi:hypothetical protein
MLLYANLSNLLVPSPPLLNSSQWRVKQHRSGYVAQLLYIPLRVTVSYSLQLTKEYVAMQKEPPPFVWAVPDEKNILTC